MTRLEDLPASVRRRIAAGEAQPAKSHTKDRREAHGPAIPILCNACGETFSHWNGKHGAEGHATTTGHRRYDLVIELTPN
jgi:hypothetical protein